jgi:hypothetical protein
MKKNLIALAIVSVASLAGISRANAQVLSKSNSLEYQKNILETKNPANELEAISPGALKKFAGTYKNVTNESWAKINDGFSTRFISNDIRTTIYYNKKGNWVGTVKYYSEDKMLHEIRHAVKSKYYDYNILYTQEVETADSEGVPTYVISLEDETTIKLIRISAGEMGVWKEYIKTN